MPTMFSTKGYWNMSNRLLAFAFQELQLNSQDTHVNST
jgi:hypothetical protein